MIKITIKGNQVTIDTEDKENETTGATKDELRTLVSIAKQLCGDCKEGAE